MKYRFLHVSFWQDPEVLEYSPEKKLLYVYLLTNSHTTQSGIYEISFTIIKFETGLNLKKIQDIMKEFVESGKIAYDEDFGEVFIVNWMKYNWSNSPKVIKAVIESLKKVKSRKLLEMFVNGLDSEQKALLEEYGYSIDTISEVYGINKKKKKNKNKEYRDHTNIEYPYSIDTVSDEGESVKDDANKPVNGNVPYQKILDLYHKYCNMLPRVRVLNDLRKKYLRARWKEFPDLKFWEEFFKRVANSKFLTGRVEYGSRPPFIADFEWLIRPTNFVKVLEGRYDNREKENKEDELLIDKILGEGDNDENTIL